MTTDEIENAVQTLRIEVTDLETAKRRCERATWSEHHDPNCAWCAFVAHANRY